MPVRTRSERRYALVVRRDVRIPTGQRDVTLSADLFLPADAGPVPVLVTALPYRRDVAAMNGSVVERWFAERGYASLLVDLRGTGSSDGSQRPPFDPGDADDAIAAIDWAAEQPWCDGTVGMWGHSYGAMTALRTAARNPAALGAIIAVQGLTDPARDFVHPGGSRGAFGPLGSWAVGTLFNQLLPPLDDFDDPAEQARWRRRMTAQPYLLDMYRHGPGAVVWADREVDLDSVEVPALCVAGWRDLFVESMIRAYERIAGPKRLIAGPWMHVLPHECPFQPIDFLGIAKSWWDSHLSTTDNDTDDEVEEPAVSVYVQGEQPRWLGFAQWPPAGEARTEYPTTWHRSEPPAPDPAVGLRSGLWSTPAGLFGLPMDQHDDDVASLCYTSPPLAGSLLVSGCPVVDVANPWPRVSVKLTDVDPVGRSIMVCAGLESAVVGTESVRVVLTPTTYQIPAGHRLRVVIAPGDFPRVWPKFADGAGWPVARALSLPVVGEVGRQVDYPLPDDSATPSGDLETGPDPTAEAVWETTSDLLNDTVSLTLAGAATVKPDHDHTRGHTLRAEQVLVATADRGEPDASSVTGSVAGVVDIDTGTHITIDVSLTATASSIEATGRITQDGETILDRRWRG